VRGGVDPVEIAEYEPEWPRLFEREAERLRWVLGGVALGIEHVGSTAVPGLAAKPVVDIQVSVASFEPQAAYGRGLERLGYVFRPDPPGDPDALHHRFYRNPEGRPRRVHIHVCEAGGRWERDHLLFRDYLAANPDVAARYEDLKRELAARHGSERGEYTRAKSPFITETLRFAERWAREANWRPRR
jgi:GrpB-like predicted nucleotidyltransferase (UPF0157 family)